MQGDSWQLAAELHKLELVHEVLAFGYSAVYVELDTVFFATPCSTCSPYRYAITQAPAAWVLGFRWTLKSQPAHYGGSDG